MSVRLEETTPMLKMRVFCLLLLVPALGAGEAPDSEEITVELKARTPEGDVRLGYSSPRRMDVETTTPRFLFEVPEFQAEDPIFFRVALGETQGVPFYGALDRTPGALYHDRLYLDLDRDLDLTNDGAPREARVRTLWTTEGKLVEFLDVELALPYQTDGEKHTEPYRCVFFFVVEKGQKTPDAVLVERDGWRQGTVTVAGQPHLLAVIDDDSDGQFSTSDSWVMRPVATEMQEVLSKDATRAMLFPSWSMDQKWTVDVKSVDPAGRRATLRVRAAKETERDYFVRVARQQQSDEERNLKIDPLRPKADGNDKVDWITDKDVKYALDVAANPRVRKRVLVAFDSPTCQWCRRMDRYTFRDREVVQLSKRFVCAKVKFVRGNDDATKYKAEATPTYVIIDLSGAEVARHAGFLRPTEFAAWLKSALR